MRNIAVVLLLLASLPSLAQEARWTPAPVPGVGAGDTILPTARTGQTIDLDRSTPFSSVPSGSVAANGATSANQTNTVRTPNLSK